LRKRAPLTKTKDPDLSHVTAASKEVAKYIRREQLIVLESTTYPGTTREIVLPILEQSGLKPGSDFYLAFSPEKVDPSNKKYNIKNTPKLIGGINADSTHIAELLYHYIADVTIPVSSPEVAEMTKVFENVFRLVNIALVNELSKLCEKMNISVWEVIKAASTKPFGYMPFSPGPGVGGHCIPLDPYYLANKAKEYDFHTRFIELAAEINEQMPYYVVSRLMDILNSQGKSLNTAHILVLGIAYKRDVADTRESPALKLVHLLQQKGAQVSYNDPYIPTIKVNGRQLNSIKLDGETLHSADCTIIATDHSSYDFPDIVAKAKLVYDTRGVTLGLKQENIIRLGE